MIAASSDGRSGLPFAPVGPDRATTRLRLDLAYDGTDFSGWARQPGRRTVQATLESALATVLRQREVSVTVAGRTDAGVHAAGQVAHVDVTSASWTAEQDQLVRRLAGVLPADLRVRSVVAAAEGFDARFSALWRRYTYRLVDAPPRLDPLRRRDTALWPRRLDAEAMAGAGANLLGLHDFAAFCRRREGGSTWRGLQELDVARDHDLLIITAQADAFCHSMVRSIVGALIAVGEGRRPLEWPADLLGLGERSSAVTVAPAHGLTLVRVGYPADEELARRAQLTRGRRDEPAEVRRSRPD